MKTKLNLNMALRAALLAALTAVLAQLQLPIGPVPFQPGGAGGIFSGHAAAPGVGRVLYVRIYGAGRHRHPGVRGLSGRACCAGKQAGMCWAMCALHGARQWRAALAAGG